MVYETGVKSHGAGFSSGKEISYYLAFSVPILFARIKIDKSRSPILYAVLVLSLIGVLLTFVRAPVVSLFIGLLSYYGYSVIYRDKNMLGTLLLICFFGLSVAAVFFVFRENPYLSRWFELGDRVEQGQVEKLGSGRVGLLTTFFQYYVYKASISAKIFGTGLGSSLELLGARKFIHNDFAEILMGLGLPGLILYLLILYKMFKILLNAVRNSISVFAKQYSIVALSYFMIFLSFHMTNLTTGVFYLFLWALFTGAIIGVARNDAGSPAGRPVIGS
jgi:O-antigen ligase